MKRLRSFIEAHPGHVLRLPTSWTAGVTTQGSEAQFPLFRAVFDAAQIGQWAGGADPMHEEIRGYCCFQNTIGCVRPGGRASEALPRCAFFLPPAAPMTSGQGDDILCIGSRLPMLASARSVLTRSFPSSERTAREAATGGRP